jgi:hypothetical protein
MISRYQKLMLWKHLIVTWLKGNEEASFRRQFLNKDDIRKLLECHPKLIKFKFYWLTKQEQSLFGNVIKLPILLKPQLVQVKHEIGFIGGFVTTGGFVTIGI